MADEMKRKLGLGEDWPMVVLFILGVLGLIILFLDIIFYQNPDIGLQVFSFTGAILLVERLVRNLFTPLGIIGLVVIILCGALEIKARLDLRKVGMTIVGSVRLEIVEGHKLLTEGIYKHIRHPLYLSQILGIIGMAMVLTSLIGVVYFAIIMIPLLLVRIRIEEEMLIEAFGDEYREYQKRTKKLIPYLF